MCHLSSAAQDTPYFLYKEKEFVACPDIDGCHYIQFVPSPAIYKELMDEGYQGGGYSWQGILMGLVSLRNIELDIEYKPEGDAFFAASNNWEAILKTEGLVLELLSDDELKKRATEKALDMRVME